MLPCFLSAYIHRGEYICVQYDMKMCLLLTSIIFVSRVFGSYEMTEFGGAVEPELALLALAKSFLLCSDGSKSISDNIDRHLLKHQLITS